MNPTATGGNNAILGALVRLEPFTAEEADAVAHLDWLRSCQPELGGWFRRSSVPTAENTFLFRDRRGGPALGVIDANPLPGYPGVINLSIFADQSAAPRGYAIDAYGICVTRLFELGARLIHHEIFEFNSQIRRILRGARVEPSAVLREHGYVAGRFWDVLVYSYGRDGWDRVLALTAHRRIGRAQNGANPPQLAAASSP